MTTIPLNLWWTLFTTTIGVFALLTIGAIVALTINELTRRK
jgi:hypothetical protein